MGRPDLPEEAELNPELYGLRRSHRERRGPVIVESDSEEDEVRPTRKRKKINDDYDEAMSDEDDDNIDEEEDDFDYDDDFGSSKKKKRGLQKLLHLLKRRSCQKQAKSTPSPPAELRFSTRNSKQVNYAIDYDDDDEDLMESEPEMDEDDDEGDYYYYQQANEPENERGIDIVMDHKINEDNTELTNDPKLDYLFKVKWTDASHLHNTWEKYQDLKNYKGFRKLDNYIKQFIIYDQEIRNDPLTTKEDIESMDIERERKETNRKNIHRLKE